MEYRPVLGIENGVAGLVLNFRISNLRIDSVLARATTRAQGIFVCGNFCGHVSRVGTYCARSWCAIQVKALGRSVNVSPGVATLLLSRIVLAV